MEKLRRANSGSAGGAGSTEAMRELSEEVSDLGLGSVVAGEGCGWRGVFINLIDRLIDGWMDPLINLFICLV